MSSIASCPHTVASGLTLHIAEQVICSTDCVTKRLFKQWHKGSSSRDCKDQRDVIDPSRWIACIGAEAFSNKKQRVVKRHAVAFCSAYVQPCSCSLTLTTKATMTGCAEAAKDLQLPAQVQCQTHMPTCCMMTSCSQPDAKCPSLYFTILLA